MNLRQIVGDHGLWSGHIRHDGESFNYFMTMGDRAMLDAGWHLVACSGCPCSYSTRSKAAVRALIENGAPAHPDALTALESAGIIDDPGWAAEKECERARRNDQRELGWQAYVEARTILVDSAKAKLTEDEFKAVQEDARDET